MQWLGHIVNLVRSYPFNIKLQPWNGIYAGILPAPTSKHHLDLLSYFQSNPNLIKILTLEI